MLPCHAPPFKVEVGLDAFLKYRPDETLPLFLKSIEDISVTKAKCAQNKDRKILEDKVMQYYRGDDRRCSFAAFERFAKYTALALVAKEIIVWRGRADDKAELAWLEPVRESAARQGFKNLVLALQTARPATWYSECGRDEAQFTDIVRGWVEQVLLPTLTHERYIALRYAARPEAPQANGSRLSGIFTFGKIKSIGSGSKRVDEKMRKSFSEKIGKTKSEKKETVTGSTSFGSMGVGPRRVPKIGLFKKLSDGSRSEDMDGSFSTASNMFGGNRKFRKSRSEDSVGKIKESEASRWEESEASRWEEWDDFGKSSELKDMKDSGTSRNKSVDEAGVSSGREIADERQPSADSHHIEVPSERRNREERSKPPAAKLQDISFVEV